jgi:two-component system nitrogen regulation response regulator GlnG
MSHLLIVDDEESIAWALTRLAEQMGHSISVASSAEVGLELARARCPDLVILDVRLPGMSGLSAMAEFREIVADRPIVLITAYGGLEIAVDAVRSGAFEYLVKPFNLQVAQQTIERALNAKRHASASEDDGWNHRVAGEIVGTSAAMRRVFKDIALVAESEACVHLSGESGTGKELIARAIHRYSARADRPFLPIHAASLTPTLAESELFGHVQGAFTGAERSKAGLLAQADGGTVFLDEVTDIPLPLQVKLLRVLEHREVWPVGGHTPVPANFRLISATQGDLAADVHEGSFRRDLYYRLVTFQIAVPSLRDRREDIEPLAEYFLREFQPDGDGVRASLAPQTLDALRERSWPGNVRELRNAIEHAVIVARGGVISPDHLPPPAQQAFELADRPPDLQQQLVDWTNRQLDHDPDTQDLYDRLLRLVEPPFFEVVLERCQGQVATAARLMGIHRSTLRKKLSQLRPKGK